MDPFMLEDTPLLFEVDGDHDDVKAFAGLFLNNNNREHVEAKMVRFDQDS